MSGGIQGGAAYAARVTSDRPPFTILPKPQYNPEAYWSRRLADDYSLRGTGHLDYNHRYNTWLYRAKARALARAMKGLAVDDPVLDVGSGVGWVVARLLEAGFEVEGCDVSRDAVGKLSRRFPDGTFFQLELGTDRIQRPDSYYGVVTMLDVAYHITDDARWLSGLTELSRVLRPGGALIVSDGFGDTDRTPAAHVRFRAEETWRRAEQVGLELTRVDPYFRWLSRDRVARGFRHLPDGLRGCIEYALERAVPRTPHMRCAVLRRTATSPPNR